MDVTVQNERTIGSDGPETEALDNTPRSPTGKGSRVSFSTPAPLRQISQWSNHFRGEESNMERPPSGTHFRRMSSTFTTEAPYDRQTSVSGVPRTDSRVSRMTSVSPASYHSDLKTDIKAPLNSNLFLAAIVVVFGSSFQFGYNIGVLNPLATHINSTYTQIMEQRKGAVSQSEITLLWSLTTALFIVGGLIGSLLGGWMADRFGRKRTLIISHLFIVVGAPLATACVAADSPEMLMIGRILFGINAGMGNCACPMFVTEITPFSIRGAFSTIPQLFITIGILMSSIFALPQILGTESTWQYLFLLELIPALTALAAIPFLHETPRFLLLIKGQRDKAKKALVFYRKTEDVSAEMEEMDTEFKVASKVTKTETFTWKQLFTTVSLRRPLLIAIMLQIMQQFSGINAVFFYSAGIFQSAGVPPEHIPYAILGTNVVNVFMTVITVPLIDRVGRRPLLIYPMLIMAVDLILLTVCLNLQSSYSWLGIVSVMSIIIYVIGFALGLGPIPMMLAAELFRQGPRPKAMALAGIVNWLGTFTIAMAFEPLKEVTKDFTFVIFSVLLVIFTIFTFLCVPETKNLTFEEISNKFSPGKNIEVELVQTSADDDDEDGVFDNTLFPVKQQDNSCTLVKFTLDTSPESPMIEKFKDDQDTKEETERHEMALRNTKL